MPFYRFFKNIFCGTMGMVTPISNMANPQRARCRLRALKKDSFVRKTKIISIEGIDGSGKGSQFALLYEALQSRGYSVQTRDYPRYESFFGTQVGRLLSGEGGVRADTVDGKSMALWFALDRWESFRDYRDGASQFLLLNRFVLSNAVYQSIRDIDLGKPDIVDWVFDLEYNHFGLPRPDVTLLFDVSSSQAEENVKKKGFRGYVGEGADVYEQSSGIQERARKKYLECAKRFEEIAVIPCMKDGILLSPPEICSRALDELQARNILP
jgi:dTMP kinase